jgi:hypothetical protein
VNVTLIVQLALTARLEPQVLVWPKSPEFVPVTLMLEMFKVAALPLVRVRDWAALVVPTVWLPKSKLLGVRVTLPA